MRVRLIFNIVERTRQLPGVRAVGVERCCLRELH